MKKIWQKDDLIEQTELMASIELFTIGNDSKFDLLLAKYDIQATLAHVKMLTSIHLIDEEEYKKIENGLKLINENIENDKFEIEEGVEDVHSQIEFTLTKLIGEAGKKIHCGRSRNDQVLTAIKLFLKYELQQIVAKIAEFVKILLTLSKTYKDDFLPGYTHYQMAMPSSFGLWFSAYAEALIDDIELSLSAYSYCDKNPLGSAAGYGSSFAINRELTTQLMGFSTMHINVINAQMSRGKTEKVVATALSNFSYTLSKFCYDVCLYVNPQFNFISFPNYVTTGSSIMPHKKNPDVFELVRGHCNIIQAVPQQLALLTANLASGYHRDMQLTKEVLFPAIQQLKNCINILQQVVPLVQVQKNICTNNKFDLLYTVEAVNKLVMQGRSFRDAYVTVGKQVNDDTFIAEKTLQHTHIGSIGNLCLSSIEEKLAKSLNQFNVPTN